MFAALHPVSYLVGTTRREGKVLIDFGTHVLVCDDAVTSTQRLLLHDKVTDLAPPAPAPTPAPVPAPVPPASSVLFDYSADLGLGVWKQVQDGLHDTQFGDSTIKVIDSPVHVGRKALQYTVSQATKSLNGPRAETAEDWTDPARRVNDGQTVRLTDTLHFPKSPNDQLGWPVPGGHSTLLQLHDQQTEGADVEMVLKRGWSQGDGLYITNNVTAKSKLLVTMGSLNGSTLDVDLTIKASRGPDGLVVLKVGGVEVFNVSGATLVGSSAYLKQGQYGESNGNVVIWHGFKRITP